MENWINWGDERPDLRDGFAKNSAIETLARRYTMHSDTLDVGWDVFRVMKLGAIYHVSYENRSEPFLVDQIRMDWLETAARSLDNMCLGTTSPTPANSDTYQQGWNGGVNTVGWRNNEVVSLYQAAQNHFTVDERHNVGGLVSSLAEYHAAAGDDRGEQLVGSRYGIIAHPAYRKILFPEGVQGKPTIGGLPVKWCKGAALSETMDPNPNGNPLLYVGDMNQLHLGVRSGPEEIMRVFESEEEVQIWNTPRATVGSGLLKIRIRRSFLVSPDNTFQCVELTS